MRGPARIALVLAAAAGGAIFPFHPHPLSLLHASQRPVALVTADTTPRADPRLRAHQGGPRCDRRERPTPRYRTRPISELEHEDLRRGATFDCAMHSGGPRARLFVRPDAQSWPDAIELYLPGGATRPAQVIPVEFESAPYLGDDFVQGVDLNRDGWTDLKVLVTQGTGGQQFKVFMFDPVRRRFYTDPVLPGGGGVVLRPGRCVGTGYRSGGENYSSEDYCWRGGARVEVRSERQYRHYGLSTRTREVFVREKRELRGGRLRLVSVDTLRGGVR